MTPSFSATALKAMSSLTPSAEPATRGHIRLLHPPTSCRMQGSALPYIYPEWKEPRAGERLRVQYVTRTMPPFPDEPAFVAVSLRPAVPVDLSVFGHTDCWLMVNLDYMLFPAEDGILTRPSPGVIELDWLLPHEFVGTTWRSQLIVATPETASGWAISPGLEFTIGSPSGANNPSLPLADTAYRGVFSWTFSEPRYVGTFATGEPWVVGPVTVVSVTPAPATVAGRQRNGSMLNPSASCSNGYDSSSFWNFNDGKFQPGLRATFPLTVQTGSVVSTLSADGAGSSSPDDRGQVGFLQDAAVLTVLAEAPPPDAFRPPYVGTDKAIPGTLADVDWTALASLQPAPGMPPLADLREHLSHLWLDHCPEWVSRYLHPREGLADYYRGFTTEIGTAALAVNCATVPEDVRRELVVRLVQIGVDNFAVMQAGARWGVNGHCNGRKFPILFAGRMLGRADMLAAGTTYAPDGGKVPFSEDGQTFYVARDADGRINGGHGGYTAADIGLPEWGNFHAENRSADDASWPGITGYRVCCSANGWVGQTLAMRVMGLREAWNQPAYFDYMDRYMTHPAVSGWQRAWEPWHAAMWDAYRGQF